MLIANSEDPVATRHAVSHSVRTLSAFTPLKAGYRPVDVYGCESEAKRSAWQRFSPSSLRTHGRAHGDSGYVSIVSASSRW
jgi:hypothetical protein